LVPNARRQRIPLMQSMHFIVFDILLQYLVHNNY
jgi:hypothetical protein